MESIITNSHVQNNNQFLIDDEPNYQVINNLSGVFTGSLIQAIWNITDCNPDSVMRLRSLFTNLRKTDVVDMMFLFDELFDFSLNKEITSVAANSDTLDYFISEFLADMDDVMDELLPGD